ncbi:MAG: hypothetical protein CBC88_00545 [Candidatus Pelagibacter sp. TMED128]|nr:MAG: hypothetical protein CBC88_00545 [Candidatus Pelagibacter sp. TMED128]|tara:strand:+ start:1433 stop:1939 length:507 start_codon:yes stop_codon:yes gene_type:complete
MENKIEKKINLIENLKQIFEKKKKIFITLIISFIIILIGVNFSGYNKKIQNEKISEKYIKAGIYLSSKDLKKSKKIYEEIVNSKNKFYSSLALNNIIENELEEDSEKILKLFKVIENIKGTKEQKDLIKLKKALFLIKINKENEGRKILEEIVSDNSIWKETAEDILQ